MLVPVEGPEAPLFALEVCVWSYVWGIFCFCGDDPTLKLSFNL